MSGIRADMSLPEALGALAERGPEAVRAPFAAFAVDYAATARFGVSLDRLKDRFADPVADRIIEALRLAQEVGGAELGALLRALSRMLREDLRTRGELRARQSWTINGARVAVCAPWLVLALLSTRPQAARAYATTTGGLVLLVGALASAIAYRLMLRLGRLPKEERCCGHARRYAVAGLVDAHRWDRRQHPHSHGSNAGCEKLRLHRFFLTILRFAYRPDSQLPDHRF